MVSSEPGAGEVRDHAYLRAKEAALRFLAYRPRSESEVRQRLSRRHGSQAIDQVITTLRQQGYLHDASFARQWRNQRERQRPRGQRALRQELLRLGVSAEVVKEALEDFDDADNAYRAGQTLASRLTESGYTQFRQRLWSHLQRRGFDSAVIGDTVRRLWRELADPLHCGIDGKQDEK